MASAVQVLTASDLIAITKSNAAVYNPMPAALYVGSTGDVNLVTAAGSTVLIPSVPAGAILPITFRQVLSTSTSASGFVGLIY